jgi:hypothetical protein
MEGRQQAQTCAFGALDPPARPALSSTLPWLRSFSHLCQLSSQTRRSDTGARKEAAGGSTLWASTEAGHRELVPLAPHRASRDLREFKHLAARLARICSRIPRLASRRARALQDGGHSFRRSARRMPNGPAASGGAQASEERAGLQDRSTSTVPSSLRVVARSTAPAITAAAASASRLIVLILVAAGRI